MKNKQNEELQSRREFFKSAVKVALPVLSGIALSTLPIKINATPVTDCSQACVGSCGYACTTCWTGCTGGCASCAEKCSRGCSGKCDSGCKEKCGYHCEGGCSGGCGWQSEHAGLNW